MTRRLEDYDAKRDFGATPEPPGETGGSETGRVYVVHKHAATRLHYDLRLEYGGVLMSWAVPKGPSLDTGQRRLAVHVEDHPVDYGSFEGTIPEGEYGGGTVMLWDRGTWSPRGDVEQSMSAGKLEFDLAGEKLEGRFALIHTGARKEGRERDRWLLIKEKDDRVRSHQEYDVTKAEPDSVATGRTMDEIAEEPAEEDAEGDPHSGARAPDPASVRGAVAGAFPAEPRPQLASPASGPPGGSGWVHEVKHDGYRLMIAVQDRRARVLTREGHDWTDRFPSLADAAAALPAEAVLLDCEAVAPGPGGVSDFGALQTALSEGRRGDVVAFCFDLLHLDGYDLRPAPLTVRKEALAGLLRGAGPLVYSDHVEGARDEVLARACEMGAEGLVSKKADSPYRPGRSRTWLKSKCVHRQEFVVVGFTEPGGGDGIGALAVAYVDDGGTLTYAGKVGSGLDERTGSGLRGRLESLRTDEPSPARTPDGAAGRDVRWVEPEVVVEVAFAGWTGAGNLRHPAFKGVREDRDPATIVRERPVAEEDEAVVLGVRLTHPERVMVPRGPTKLDLARYYAAVAPHVLRHLAGRPLTLLRCPEGSAGECFWQRHVEEGLLAHVAPVTAHDKDYVFVREPAGLVELVQYLVVEFHVWGVVQDHPDRPDRLVFDLDPGPDVDWDTVRAAALAVREVLAGRKLTSFVKTSGGKGVHVVVPIQPEVPVTDAALAAKVLAEDVVAASGGTMTVDPRKSARPGRIFLDWHRNGAGQSTVAAYTVRAREGAAVSTPLTWDELRAGTDPADLTPEVVLAKLEVSGDPWEDIGEVGQRLPQEALPGV